jgi:hypothetical protein
MDYDEALKRYHATGAPSDWQQHYVSAYATTHPWEDFAETWAHYLHIVDTLEMAAEFGLEIHPVRDQKADCRRRSTPMGPQRLTLSRGPGCPSFLQ